MRHPKLSILEGNVSDASKVQQAVAGKEAVLSALGANQVFRYDSIVVNGLSHIVKAMADLRVNRLIYLSTLGVPASSKGAGLLIRALAPTLLRYEIRGHQEREQIVQASPLQWTIVRAPILTNGERTECYKADVHLKSPHFATKLSRADVAHCMLAQLRQDCFVRKAISVMP
jgi:putative NADH-flavin reductase